MESFLEFYRGELKGVMTEDAYVGMADTLQGEWFAVCFSEKPLKFQKINGDGAGEILRDLLAEVKKRKSLSGTFPYTYVRNRENPEFIKLYDPKQCGGSCSTVAPPPWWVFSRVEPMAGELAELDKGFQKKR